MPSRNRSNSQPVALSESDPTTLSEIGKLFGLEVELVGLDPRSRRTINLRTLFRLFADRQDAVDKLFEARGLSLLRPELGLEVLRHIVELVSKPIGIEQIPDAWDQFSKAAEVIRDVFAVDLAPIGYPYTRPLDRFQVTDGARPAMFVEAFGAETMGKLVEAGVQIHGGLGTNPDDAVKVANLMQCKQHLLARLTASTPLHGDVNDADFTLDAAGKLSKRPDVFQQVSTAGHFDFAHTFGDYVASIRHRLPTPILNDADSASDPWKVLSLALKANHEWARVSYQGRPDQAIYTVEVRLMDPIPVKVARVRVSQFAAASLVYTTKHELPSYDPSKLPDTARREMAYEAATNGVGPMPHWADFSRPVTAETATVALYNEIADRAGIENFDEDGEILRVVTALARVPVGLLISNAYDAILKRCTDPQQAAYEITVFTQAIEDWDLRTENLPRHVSDAAKMLEEMGINEPALAVFSDAAVMVWNTPAPEFARGAQQDIPI